MNRYRLNIGIEPLNDYDKAKQDLYQALVSIQKLTPQQQQELAKEFFGVANVVSMCNILQQYLG